MVRLDNYTSDYHFSCLTVKHWIRRNWRRVQVAEYPEIALLESSAAVAPESSRGWFIHSGYNVM